MEKQEEIVELITDVSVTENSISFVMDSEFKIIFLDSENNIREITLNLN
ncbi:hypothetical protein [Desulfurobacterium sp. TC5-1]|nr:hypothetical protein [Desulfurobacterium sp. TC5-1]